MVQWGDEEIRREVCVLYGLLGGLRNVRFKLWLGWVAVCHKLMNSGSNAKFQCGIWHKIIWVRYFWTKNDGGLLFSGFTFSFILIYDYIISIIHITRMILISPDNTIKKIKYYISILKILSYSIFNFKTYLEI